MGTVLKYGRVIWYDFFTSKIRDPEQQEYSDQEIASRGAKCRRYSEVVYPST